MTGTARGTLDAALPRRVLITGGAGFVGSHVADALIEQGCSVVAVDDLSTGSLDNLEQLSGNPGFTLEVGSAADSEMLATLLSECDACVHLAAVVGVKLVLRQPARALEINARCTEAVLEAAARHSVPVLVASSSEVYGQRSTIPLCEDMDLEISLRGGHSAYAVSKLYSERLALSWERQAGLPVIIARLFNTAGPRQIPDHGMVVPSLARQALRNQPLTVFGDGAQTRSFAHVRDIAESLIRLLATPAAHGQIYNVGAQQELTILDLARRVKRRANSDSEIVRVPYQEAYGTRFEDIRRRAPDVTKLERLLGSVPTIGIDQIIDDVLAYWTGPPAERVAAEVSTL